MEETAKNLRKEKIKDYIDASSKSPTLGVLYTFFFGPFGCIYTVNAPESASIVLARAD